MIFKRINIFIIFLYSCGIPSYSYLEKPVVMEEYVSDEGKGVTLVGFKTPSNDANIIGYDIFYKIYSRDDDQAEIEKDEKYFDENTYINSEMTTGDKIPNDRGFIKLGEYDVNASVDYLNRQFYVKHPGADIPVFIDFNPTDTEDEADKRAEPIVSFNAPGSANKVKIIARGFNDPLTHGNFLSFVNDWNLVNNDSDVNIDGDLIRAYNLLSKQPLSENVSGNPIFSLDTGVDIRIGFVVYSTGFSVDEGLLTKIDSKPVYLGWVLYSPANDTTER